LSKAPIPGRFSIHGKVIGTADCCSRTADVTEGTVAGGDRAASCWQLPTQSQRRPAMPPPGRPHSQQPTCRSKREPPPVCSISRTPRHMGQIGANCCGSFACAGVLIPAIVSALHSRLSTDHTRATPSRCSTLVTPNRLEWPNHALWTFDDAA